MWKEGWRQVERPDASEIPEPYALWPGGTDRLVVVYFVAVILVSYLGLRFLGTRSVLVGGLPVLMLVTMIISLLFVVGLWLLAYRSRGGGQPRP